MDNHQGMGRALGCLEGRQVSGTGYHRYGDNITAAFQETEQVGQRSQGTEVTFIQGKSIVIYRLNILSKIYELLISLSKPLSMILEFLSCFLNEPILDQPVTLKYDSTAGP